MSDDADDFSHPRVWSEKSLTSSMRTVHTPLSRSRFSATPQGEVETVSRFHRLHPEGLCNTLRAGTGHDRGSFTSPRPIHPHEPRVLTVREAAREIKSQRADCVRDGEIDSGITLAHLFRALPLGFYMRLIKHELRGEICSLFFGDTSMVDPALTRMFGVEITGFAHLPAMTVPPGVGIVFYHFRDRLQFTLFHAQGTLSEAEVDEFARCLQERLINP